MKTTIVTLRAFGDKPFRCMGHGPDIAVDPDYAAPVPACCRIKRHRTANKITDRHAALVDSDRRLPAKYSVPVFGPADGTPEA